MSLKTFLHKNQISTGVIVGLGLEIIGGFLLWVGLSAANIPIAANLRLFAAIFILPLLALRYYVKKTQHNVIIKTLMVLLFVTFIAYMFILL